MLICGTQQSDSVFLYISNDHPVLSNCHVSSKKYNIIIDYILHTLRFISVTPFVLTESLY